MSTWRPEYPGQKEPVWAWWSKGEREDDLLGFHTRSDRDAFSRGEQGPFRRRLCPRGETGSPQTIDGLHDMVARIQGKERPSQ